MMNQCIFIVFVINCNFSMTRTTTFDQQSNRKVFIISKTLKNKHYGNKENQIDRNAENRVYSQSKRYECNNWWIDLHKF